MNKAEINQLAKALIPKLEEALLRQNDEILTPQDVAKMLQISVSAVRTRCQRKQLPYKRKGGRLYFSKNAITKHYLSD